MEDKFFPKEDVVKAADIILFLLEMDKSERGSLYREAKNYLYSNRKEDQDKVLRVTYQQMIMAAKQEAIKAVEDIVKDKTKFKKITSALSGTEEYIEIADRINNVLKEKSI